MLKQESSKKTYLHIYKASAGSGKTYQLTMQYLNLLYASPKDSYRYILAVTFTNKATDEMKTRIIHDLALIATGEESPYIQFLSEQHNISEELVRLRGREILIRILHDYSAFSVSTIDRFFQQTMRAFTREIGLGGNYNVELDTSKVLGEAIENLLGDLEQNNNELLLDWLVRFSSEKIEKGETWNIRNDIQSLSSEIFKESYKQHSDEVQKDTSNKELITEYKNMLFVILSQFANTQKQIAEKALNIIFRYDLSVNDFKGGSRSAFRSFLDWATGDYKAPTSTFQKMVDDLPSWYTAKTPADIKQKIEDAYNELNVCCVEIVQHYEKNSLVYLTALEINRYFFTLGILGDVDKKIREYAAEKNIMLISDTTELLYKIIDGNDTPFIYEKVGQRVNHYMIDEFQDTSGMQWQNFRPLVADSLASANQNFIVGDVKQSIYRWRNSDWELLDKQLDIDFLTEGVSHQVLDTNWRSAKNVVNFNNAIFATAAQMQQEVYNNDLPAGEIDTRYASQSKRITSAYSTLYQHVADKHKDTEGRVQLHFVDTEEHEDWQAYALEQLPTQIEELQDRGYALKDIAILVRKKAEGVAVADCLLKYKNKVKSDRYRYDIISDESLYVGSASSIKLIVALLKFLKNPLDKSLRAIATYEYFKFNEQIKSEEALLKYFSASEVLPEFVSKRLEAISELAIYEMVEALCELFADAINKDEQIYLQAFLDMTLEYTVRNSSDLDAFLNWWDKTGSGKMIFTPDGQDAIRIMTIHKSKGLEFEAVLMPFCNWSLDHEPFHDNILWCEPKMEPFDSLHLVPIKYGTRLKDTVFAQEYFDERLHTFIDNINLLYVAFTRAKQELIVYCMKPRREGLQNASALLWQCVNMPNRFDEKYISLSDYLNEDEARFDLGESHKPQAKERKANDKEMLIDVLPSISFEDRLRLQLSNKYFFTPQGKRDYGTLMHEIISTISTIDDIERAVEDYYISGDLTSKQHDEVVLLLHGFFENEQMREWYTKDYRVLNEVQILQPNGSFIRPDRVMIKGKTATVIDYKFGEKESKSYNKQVANYMRQISKIGYQDVKGYICYVQFNKIEEIVI